MNKELEPLGGVDVPTFNNVWQWVKDLFNQKYQSEVETYLSQSADLVDLEHRMNNLQRKGLL